MIQVTSPEGTIHYAYDPATGRQTKMWTSQTEIDYAHDPLGRLVTVTEVERAGVVLGIPVVTKYTYDAVGGQTGQVTTQGSTTLLSTTNTFDPQTNQLSSVVNTGGSGNTISSFTYTRRADGQITQVTESVVQPDGTTVTGTTTYEYDAMNRLTRETYTTGGATTATTYVLDRVGNRVSVTAGGTTTTSIYNARDQLLTSTTESTTITSTYDANGSLATQGGGGSNTVYTYDARGRITSAAVTQGSSSTTETFTYTPDGIRSGVTVNGVTTRYLVDELSPSGYAQVIEEWTNASNGNLVLTASFVFGSGLVPISTTRVSRDANGTVTGTQTGLFLTDGHSAPRQVVDATSGAVVRAVRYDAFGNTVATAGTFQTPIGYQGQRFDAVLGQYDMRARMYDPTSGRFTGMDPEAGTYSDPLQLMRYGYAGANPVWRIDPSGREFSIGGFFSGFGYGGSLSAINPHAAGTGQDTAFGIGLGISRALGCSGVQAFQSIMGPPMGMVLGAAVGFYGGFIAGYADALADNPLVGEDKLMQTAIVSGILGAIQGILAFAYLGGVGRSACFTAGTPLRTPDGATPIEQLKPGDLVLARDEYDPTGPVEEKLVEEVFVYESQVLYLTVGGQRIGTTSEHPFYVPERREWIKAGELRPGDMLVGHDGQTLAIQAIEAGEWATVYNLRVQDYHTYFVGCDEWGFSVWAHNACVAMIPVNWDGMFVLSRGVELAQAAWNWRVGRIAHSNDRGENNVASVTTMTNPHPQHFGSAGKTHSEQKIINVLKNTPPNKRNVIDIFSERHPCPKSEKNCEFKLRFELSGQQQPAVVIVYYLVEYKKDQFGADVRAAYRTLGISG